MVHRFCFAEPADGSCGLAQHQTGRSLLCGYICCRGFAPCHAGVAAWRRRRSKTLYGGDYRVRRLAVSSLAGAAAGFESSAYVGGITFAVMVLVAAPFLLFVMKPAQRWRFVVAMAVAAVLAIVVVAPFLQNQFHAVAAR